MTLAAASTVAQPFNADYYAPMGTVIPVLFLAIAVQGRIYDDLLKAGGRRVLASLKQCYDFATLSAAVRAGSITRREAVRRFFDPGDLRRLALGWTCAVVAAFILIYAVAGEISALLSLYDRRPVGGAETPLQGGGLLACAMAVPPAAALARTLHEILREQEGPAASAVAGQEDAGPGNEDPAGIAPDDPRPS